MEAKYANHKNHRSQSTYVIRLEIGFIAVLLLLISIASVPIKGKEVHFEPIKVFEPEPNINLPEITKHVKAVPKPQKPIISALNPVVSVIEVTIPIELPEMTIELIEPFVQSSEEEIFEPFVRIERQPEINGGYAAFAKNLVYPKLAREVGITGKVVLGFVVNEKGKPIDIKVLRGIGGGCDEAAIEALKKITFSPGIQRGRPVKVRFVLPVNFKLNSN